MKNKMKNKRIDLVEKALRNYYKQPKQIKNLQHQVGVLKKQLEKIETDIKTTNVHLNPDCLTGIDYARDKIQTSFNGTYPELEICRQVQKLENEKLDTISQINFLEKETRNIERNNAIVEDNIETLSPEFKQFVRYMYRDGRSCEWISTVMYDGARATAYRRRNEVIQSILQWFRFSGQEEEALG